MCRGVENPATRGAQRAVSGAYPGAYDRQAGERILRQPRTIPTLWYCHEKMRNNA